DARILDRALRCEIGGDRARETGPFERLNASRRLPSVVARVNPGVPERQRNSEILDRRIIVARKGVLEAVEPAPDLVVPRRIVGGGVGEQVAGQELSGGGAGQDHISSVRTTDGSLRPGARPA